MQKTSSLLGLNSKRHLFSAITNTLVARFIRTCRKFRARSLLAKRRRRSVSATRTLFLDCSFFATAHLCDALLLFLFLFGSAITLARYTLALFRLRHPFPTPSRRFSAQSPTFLPLSHVRSTRTLISALRATSPRSCGTPSRLCYTRNSFPLCKVRRQR